MLRKKRFYEQNLYFILHYLQIYWLVNGVLTPLLTVTFVLFRGDQLPLVEEARMRGENHQTSIFKLTS